MSIRTTLREALRDPLSRRGWRLGTTGRWSILSAIVGLLVGFCCIAFDVLTQAVGIVGLQTLAGFVPGWAIGEPEWFGPLQTAVASSSSPSAAAGVSGLTLKPWMLVAVMTSGGLLSGLLAYRFCAESAGAGTDAAVDAFHNGKGLVRPRVVVIKTLASAVTLGTGGSGGREGPIAHIGAAVGSWLATRVGLTVRDRRILLAAGMGAGVGTMFRAPLAGAIFAGEILYSDSDMEADVIVPSAIASIVGYSVYTQALPENVRYQPLFGHHLDSSPGTAPELLPFIGLAVVLFVLAAAYVKLFHMSQRVFARLPGPQLCRPAIGAFLAGTLGVTLHAISDSDMMGKPSTLAAAAAHPDGPASDGQGVLNVLGTGYGILQTALTDPASLASGILIAVCLGKMLTTSLTIGSGGSGGVFGPSMVIGGCAGAVFGKGVQTAFPHLAANPESFAIVGMAGYFAGVARAPISTIIMVRELTGDFGLLVPTLLVSTLTFLASAKVPLYLKQVSTRMRSPAHRGDFLVDVLEGLRVDDVYRRDRRVMVFSEATSLDDIVHRMAKTNQHYFPVVDQDGAMVGIFSDDDVRAYLYDETLWRLANAGDVMISDFVRVHPSEDLNATMQKFTALNLDELPVMDETEPGRLLGFLRRKETIAAYNRRILEHRREVERETA